MNIRPIISIQQEASFQLCHNLKECLALSIVALNIAFAFYDPLLTDQAINSFISSYPALADDVASLIVGNVDVRLSSLALLGENAMGRAEFYMSAPYHLLPGKGMAIKFYYHIASSWKALSMISAFFLTVGFTVIIGKKRLAG